MPNQISETACDALLETLRGNSLVNKHNELAEKLALPRVKKFSTRRVGLRRIKRLMTLLGILPEGTVQVEWKVRQKVFRYPASVSPANPRDSSLRGRVKILLLGGATFAEVASAIGDYDILTGVRPVNLERRAYRVIHELHKSCGWGLREEVREHDKQKVIVCFAAHALQKSKGARRHAI